VARREFDWLVIGPQSTRCGDPDFFYEVEAPAEVGISRLGVTLRFKIVGAEELGRAYNKHGEWSLDAQKLPGGLVLRNWRPGDRFQPVGCRKLLKLKELFRQRKIPLEQRGAWPVLVSGKEIVWVRDFPVAASVAASAASRNVLIITEESQLADKARRELR
jgi:tRNA(Ile)-lysidine synthase